MKFNTVGEAIEYLHQVTKQQEIRDETNKLIDRCYTKGSHDLMVFQRQKFLNELLPLFDGLGVVLIVDSKGHESHECDWCYWSTHKVESLIYCSSCKKEPCECPSINRGSFAKYVEEG